jgi:hypothetical protein
MVNQTLRIRLLGSHDRYALYNVDGECIFTSPLAFGTPKLTIAAQVVTWIVHFGVDDINVKCKCSYNRAVYDHPEMRQLITNLCENTGYNCSRVKVSNHNEVSCTITRTEETEHMKFLLSL